MDRTGNTGVKFSVIRVSQYLRPLVLASFVLISLGLGATSMANVKSGIGAGVSAFLEEVDTNEVLPPEQAFGVELYAQDERTLRTDFQIAPGHYLYKDRFRFEVLS